LTSAIRDLNFRGGFWRQPVARPPSPQINPSFPSLPSRFFPIPPLNAGVGCVGITTIDASASSPSGPRQTCEKQKKVSALATFTIHYTSASGRDIASGALCRAQSVRFTAGAQCPGWPGPVGASQLSPRPPLVAPSLACSVRPVYHAASTYIIRRVCWISVFFPNSRLIVDSPGVLCQSAAFSCPLTQGPAT